MAPPRRRHVENACTRNEQERSLEEARARRVKKKCSAVLALEKHMGWIRCGVCVCVCVVSGLARVPCVLDGCNRLVIITLWRLTPGDMASLDAGSSVAKMLCESSWMLV
jgi:hypothetical protein